MWQKYIIKFGISLIEDIAEILLIPDTYAKSFQEITCMMIREQITCQENKITFSIIPLSYLG